jgi:TRAP-type mannitol/chloroaromatic compound transport system permease small subunit
MQALRLVLRVIDATNRWVAKIVSWVVILIIGATVYEVIRRYVFGSPTQWVFEFNYLVHGPYFMLLGAYVLAIGGHVNVDILYARLSRRWRAVLDCLTAPLFFFFTFMMFYYGSQFALKSVALRETLSSAWAPPIYPFKLTIPVAAALIILQGAAQFVRNLYLAVTGRELEK